MAGAASVGPAFGGVRLYPASGNARGAAAFIGDRAIADDTENRFIAIGANADAKAEAIDFKSKKRKKYFKLKRFKLICSASRSSGASGKIVGRIS